MLQEMQDDHTVPVATVQGVETGQNSNFQVNHSEGYVGPDMNSINAIIPQTDGAGDAFWEDLMYAAEDSFMECTEELSDINSDDSNHTVSIHYFLKNNSWPQDPEMLMMRMDVDYRVEGSSLNSSDIPFASSIAITGPTEDAIMANFKFSLLEHVYTSKDFMNLFLFQDLIGIQDWADLWPMTEKTIDKVLGRWAYYLEFFYGSR